MTVFTGTKTSLAETTNEPPLFVVLSGASTCYITDIYNIYILYKCELLLHTCKISQRQKIRQAAVVREVGIIETK